MTEDRNAWLHRRTAWLYEPLRRFFAGREHRHQGLRADLNGARMSVTLSGYLARSAVFAILNGIFGALAGVIATFVLVDTGVLAGISGVGGTGAVGAFVGEHRTAVVGVVLPVVLAVTLGLATWIGRYYLPRQRASARARAIDVALPQSVTYLYALSRGGINISTGIEKLARSKETYGVVAEEMGLVVNQTEYLGADFMQALQSAAEITPSASMSDFFEDLLNVVESGGDVEAFLLEKREESLQDARATQATYLENMALFAEVYVSLVVAGGLLALVLLMVIGILGSPTLPAVNALVYAGIPGVSLLAILALDLLRGPFSDPQLSQTDTGSDVPSAPDDPAAGAYARRKRRRRLYRSIRHPFDRFVARPTTVLVLSVPLSALVAGGLVLTETVEPTATALYDSPVRVTVLLAVVPFVVATAPLSIAYEIRRHRIDDIRRRFPDLLSSLASANRMGIRLTEAIDNVAGRSGNVLSGELTRLNNEIGWFHELRPAFRRAANRARAAVVVRTFRLIADSTQASSNVAETLSVAARDARSQRELARERARELSSYTAASVVAFLVFLGVVLIVDQYYFQEAIAVSQQTATDGPDLPASLSSINADGFELAFFHAALVQAVFIGLVTGKLVRGTAIGGLRYSLGLLAVTVVAFTVI